MEQSAFQHAREGNTDALKELILGGFSVNSKDQKGNSLLMIASYKGQEQTVKMLIYYGADVNATNSEGLSILAGTAFKGHLEICKILVQNKAVITPSFFKSPLFFAAMFGQKDVVKYLLDIKNQSGAFLYKGFANLIFALKPKKQKS